MGRATGWIACGLVLLAVGCESKDSHNYVSAEEIYRQSQQETSSDLSVEAEKRRIEDQLGVKSYPGASMLSMNHEPGKVDPNTNKPMIFEGWFGRFSAKAKPDAIIAHYRKQLTNPEMPKDQNGKVLTGRNTGGSYIRVQIDSAEGGETQYMVTIVMDGGELGAAKS